MAGKNQGAGTRDAARAYNESTREFVDSGKVESSAQDAKRARQGAERRGVEHARSGRG